jgi:cytidylate kinase
MSSRSWKSDKPNNSIPANDEAISEDSPQETSNLAPKKSAKIIVTIDGGAATNKSPIASSLAKSFDLVYLEMGNLYRTIANVLTQRKLESQEENKQKIEEFLNNISWKTTVKKRQVCFVVDGEIFSDRELHSKSNNIIVSVYAYLFESIHHFCYKVARSILHHVEEENYSGLIAEGRTCGTLFFPEADLKFYLNMAHRKQKFKPGNWVQADTLDQARPFFPLKKEENAIPIWVHKRSSKDNSQILAAFIEQKLDEKNELAQLEEAEEEAATVVIV